MCRELLIIIFTFYDGICLNMYRSIRLAMKMFPTNVCPNPVDIAPLGSQLWVISAAAMPKKRTIKKSFTSK